MSRCRYSMTSVPDGMVEEYVHRRNYYMNQLTMLVQHA